MKFNVGDYIKKTYHEGGHIIGKIVSISDAEGFCTTNPISITWTVYLGNHHPKLPKEYSINLYDGNRIIKLSDDETMAWLI